MPSHTDKQRKLHKPLDMMVGFVDDRCTHHSVPNNYQKQHTYCSLSGVSLSKRKRGFLLRTCQPEGCNQQPFMVARAVKLRSVAGPDVPGKNVSPHHIRCGSQLLLPIALSPYIC